MMNRSVAAVALVIVLGGVAGCSSPTSHAQSDQSSAPAAPIAPQDGDVYFVDGPAFDSLAELAQRSQSVVEGTFTRHVSDGNEADLATSPPSGATGLPVELWEVNVTKVLKGDVPKTIVVAEIGPGVEGAVHTAKPDRHSLLFLNAYENGTYAVVGLGAGSIELQGSKLSAPDGVTPSLKKDIDGHADESKIKALVVASK